MQLRPGTLLQRGKYRILEVLGQGGFGITYEAEHVYMEEKVAVKEFFMKDFCYREEGDTKVTVPPTGNRETVGRFRAKFLREAKMIRALNNPRIVRVTDFFEENGTAYYVMDYIPGHSVKDKVESEGPFDESTALGYVKDICEALEYIHGASILHLDLKPSNILLDTLGHAVLIDFGVSKHYDEQGNATSSTPTGISKGYAPLEQYRSCDVSEFKPSTDIYSLGATLFYMLTGENPPEAPDLVGKGLQMQDIPVSDATRRAISSAMSPIADNRPQSVREFVEILEGKEIVADDADKTSVDNEETQIVVEPTEKTLSNNESKPAVRRRIFKWKWPVIIGGALIAVLALWLLIPKGSEKGTSTAPDGEELNQIPEGINLKVGKTSFRMVKVDGGYFRSGPFFTYSGWREAGLKPYNLDSLSLPKVKKEFVAPFYIGETEVTQSLWMEIMGENPSEYKSSQFPVDSVSYSDCLEFIEKLNERMHKQGTLLADQSFRLPTDLEWEYAAKGGSMGHGYIFAGSNVIDDVAWHIDNKSESVLHKVKCLRPNELGLYDMSGNVAEICSANKKGDFYSRGGGWDSAKEDCTVISRKYQKDESDDIGLRLALSLSHWSVTLRGSVFDNRGEALVGTGIQIVGKSGGAVCDESGRFTLKAFTDDVLEFSSFGYETLLVPVDGRDTLSVIMADDKLLDRSDYSSDSVSGHSYVDLGLSVRWATCNIGAEQPENDGVHFAWGELAEKDNDRYTWEDYKFVKADTVSGKPVLKFTKYYFEDNHPVPSRYLEFSDDVARQQWGSPWRIPTKEHIEELLTFCENEMTTRGSQSGYKVTGPSGNSIFLPMAGIIEDSELRWVGSSGYYWLSVMQDSYLGNILFFDKSKIVLGNRRKYRGLSIRPVAD